MISPKERERILKTPEFIKRFGKITDGMQIGSDMLNIAASFIPYCIEKILPKISFTSLGMDVENYKQITGKDISKWSWGLIHKSCHLIISQTPELLGVPVSEYLIIITDCDTIISHINTLCADKTDEAIQSVYSNELLSGKKH